MINALLQLDDCIVKSLEIRSRATMRQLAKAANELGVANFSVSFNVLQSENDALKFLIPLSITITWDDDKSSSFEKIAIELNGFFSFPEFTPAEEVQKYVPLHCLSNLLGIARGVIAQATGTFPEGTFYLPLINLVDIVREAQDVTE